MEEESPIVDFSNTQIAFSNKSDRELIRTLRLFQLMNNPSLVNLGTKLSLTALKLHIPLTQTLIKQTIYKQFCGGTSLRDTQATVNHLRKYKVLAILDYGAEGLSDEEDLDKTREEFVRAVEFAASNTSIPVVSVKVTALADKALLEKVQSGATLSSLEHNAFKRVVSRVNDICQRASELEVRIFIDAEESWLQNPIDHMVEEMMKKYNRERVTVYNTFQMYRTDRLAYLQQSYEEAKSEGYQLGAKLVRGAYMEKERQRALEMGYPSPIHASKENTDKAYDDGIRFCIDHYEDMASCNASHNTESNRLQAELVIKKGIHPHHPHINFCQLYGMSDNITFNLAAAGFNVAKYVVYGPVSTVIHYLVRRAQENTSITGDMSRELGLLIKEKERRGL